SAGTPREVSASAAPPLSCRGDKTRFNKTRPPESGPVGFVQSLMPSRAVIRNAFPVLVLLTLPFPAPGAVPDFTREVRPLLEERCVKCHGPEKQKGGLRFDTKEGAFKKGESGEAAI